MLVIDKMTALRGELAVVALSRPKGVGLLAVAATMVGAWACGDEALSRRDNPVPMARAFLAAARLHGDCPRAWGFFTPESQRYFTEQTLKEKMDSDWPEEVVAPVRRGCNEYEWHLPKTVELQSRAGDRATLKVKKEEPDPNGRELLPGWGKMGRIEVPATLEAVRRAGVWKISHPGSEAPRPPGAPELIDAGSGVILSRARTPYGAWTIDASAKVGASLPQWKHTLFDLESWPHFWPRLVEARWLGPPKQLDGSRSAYLRFDLPSGPADCVIRVDASPSAASLRWQKVADYIEPVKPGVRRVSYDGNLSVGVGGNINLPTPKGFKLRWHFSRIAAQSAGSRARRPEAAGRRSQSAVGPSRIASRAGRHLSAPSRIAVRIPGQKPRPRSGENPVGLLTDVGERPASLRAGAHVCALGHPRREGDRPGCPRHGAGAGSGAGRQC